MRKQEQPGDPPLLLRFTPVPLARTRASGWTAERQVAFIAALARTGVVKAAADSVGMSARSAWQLRDRALRIANRLVDLQMPPEALALFGPGWTYSFAHAWDLALDPWHDAFAAPAPRPFPKRATGFEPTFLQAPAPLRSSFVRHGVAPMHEQEPLDALRFTPVPVPPRAGGWSAERQVAFIQCLRRIGVVAAAARSVGMTGGAAYALRRRAGPDSGFAQAWNRALDEAQSEAIDVARTRGLGPIREPMFRAGRQVGWRERYDNRLLYAALRALDGASGRFTTERRPAPARPDSAAAPSATRGNKVARRRNYIADSPGKV